MRAIRRVLKEAEAFLRERFPGLAEPRYPALPGELEFVHAEDVLAAPDLPPAVTS